VFSCFYLPCTSRGWVPSMLFFIYMIFHQLIENGFAQFNNYALIMFGGHVLRIEVLVMLGVCIERFSCVVKAGASRHVRSNKHYKPDYVSLCTLKVFRINIKLYVFLRRVLY
jgi:phage-related holin